MKLKDKSNKTAEVLVPTTHLPLELIVDHPDVGNRALDKAWVEELKASIHANGLDVPVIVWDGGSEYPTMEVKGKEHSSSFLIAGLHRRAALRALRKEDAAWFDKTFPNGIPVVVKSGELKEALYIQLRENVDRKNPTAEELLPKIIRLRDEFMVKNKEIAKRIGRSEAYVSEILSIEKELGEEGTDEVVKGGVTAKHALEAAKEVKKAKKEGKTPDVKAAVEKAKAKTEKNRSEGRQRDEKRTSVKKLYSIYKSLPSMSIGKKLLLAEAVLQYSAGETDKLPKELQLDKDKETESED